MELFCDNTAVVEVCLHQKPKNPEMAKFSREFLYLIVTYKFVPVIKKIGTKENWLADYVSRIFDKESHKLFFEAKRLGIMKHIPSGDHQFSFSASW